RRQKPGTSSQTIQIASPQSPAALGQQSILRAVGTITDRSVRPFLIVIFRQSHLFCASPRLRNQCALRDSARKRPLNASMKALSVGFPGRERGTEATIKIVLARDGALAGGDVRR